MWENNTYFYEKIIIIVNVQRENDVIIFSIMKILLIDYMFFYNIFFFLKIRKFLNLVIL